MAPNTGNVFSNIVYNAKGSNVSHTIVNGKILMEDREIKNIDKYMVFDKCREIIERISE